jgi:hypothetical protein
MVLAPSSVKGHPRHRKAAELKPDLRNERRVITFVIDYYIKFPVMKKVYEVINGLKLYTVPAVL